METVEENTHIEVEKTKKKGRRPNKEITNELQEQHNKVQQIAEIYKSLTKSNKKKLVHELILLI